MNYTQWAASLGAPLARLADRLGDALPHLLGAAALLLVGWVLARLLRAWITRLVRGLDRLAHGRGIQGGLQRLGVERPASEVVGGIVFWVVFLFFLAAATERLGLPVVTTGLSTIAYYLPRVLAGVAIVFAGYLAGHVAREALAAAATSAGIPYGAPLGRAAQIGILLVALVIGLNQLGIDSTFLGALLAVVLAALLGGGALAFALGARTAVTNIIASYYLLRVYRVGHTVRLGGVQGRILEITPTAVLLETSGGRVHVPAKVFSEETSLLVTQEG